MERQAEPEPRRASRESSASLSFRPAASLAARARAAKAEAEEAIPAPDGKLFSLTTSACALRPARCAHQIQQRADALERGTGHLVVVDDQFIEGQRALEADRGARVQPVQVHGDGAVGGKAQRLIPVAPVLNEGDVGMRLRRGGPHAASLTRGASPKTAHQSPL